MTDTMIPQEWIEAALRASCVDVCSYAPSIGCHGVCKRPWDDFDADERRNMRITLTAVAPLIAARERERAAAIAKGYAERIAEMSGGIVPSVVDVACETIAAAIRERGKE